SPERKGGPGQGHRDRRLPDRQRLEGRCRIPERLRLVSRHPRSEARTRPRAREEGGRAEPEEPRNPRRARRGLLAKRAPEGSGGDAEEGGGVGRGRGQAGTEEAPEAVRRGAREGERQGREELAWIFRPPRGVRPGASENSGLVRSARPPSGSARWPASRGRGCCSA